MQSLTFKNEVDMRDKLILFDWGNILINMYPTSKDPNHSILKTGLIDKLHPKDENAFKKLLKDDRFWRLSGNRFNELIYEYLKESGTDCSVQDFRQAYIDIMSEVSWFTNTVELTKQLYNEGKTRIGILSTMSELDKIVVENTIDLNKYDYTFLSCDLGMSKPESQIYSLVENVSHTKPENILFFDDLDNNIKMAEKHGWKGKVITGDKTDIIKEVINKFCNSNYPSALIEINITDNNGKIHKYSSTEPLAIGVICGEMIEGSRQSGLTKEVVDWTWECLVGNKIGETFERDRITMRVTGEY
jgi:FMN phosphatase YigB (HAD superfamily)